MTVLLEKSTLLPDKLPRKRPVFPFRRCTNPLVVFLGCKENAEGADEETERWWLPPTHCHGGWDALHVTVDIQGTLQLQVVPTLLQHQQQTTSSQNMGQCNYLIFIEHQVVNFYQHQSINSPHQLQKDRSVLRDHKVEYPLPILIKYTK